MNPEEMKLPEFEKEKSPFILHAFLHKEWVIDPPPWIASRLREELIVDIYRIKMKHLAELAKTEIQIKEIESKMFGDIAQAMSRGK